MRTIEEVLRPPTDAEATAALARFAADARRHYGPRLLDLFLFGSRARGDARPDSDADVAVILTDGAWRIIDEARLLADLSYDRLIEDGLDIQAHPVSQSAWNDPALHPNPTLIRAMQRDARLIEDSALAHSLTTDGQTMACATITSVPLKVQAGEPCSR